MGDRYTDTPHRQSLSMVFIERRVKGSEKRERQRDRETAICLLREMSENKEQE